MRQNQFLCTILLVFLVKITIAQDNNVKISFSIQPFSSLATNDGKKSFKSGEYIYGQFQATQNLEEHFSQAYRYYGDREKGGAVIYYKVSIVKEGQVVLTSTKRSFFKVHDLKKNFFNFDVLPDPEKASTRFFESTNLGTAPKATPLYTLFGQNSTLGTGIYTVKIAFMFPDFNWPENTWNAENMEFEFQYNANDYAVLKQNLNASNDQLAMGKFYYSTQPFTDVREKNTDIKSNFKSSEKIYGRLELPSSVEEYFKLPATTKKLPTPSLVFKFTIYKDGEMTTWGRSLYGRVSNIEKKRNYFNFDILPAPAVASTIVASGPELSQGAGSSPLYDLLIDRNNFPEPGWYTVAIQWAQPTYDPYDPSRPNPEEKWINCIGEFEIEFDVNDVPVLRKAGEEADALVKENARIKQVEERGLPDEWNISSAEIKSGHTLAQINQMFLKNESATCKIIKTIIHPTTDNNWHIEKNEYDLPIQKYHNQPIGVFAQNNGRCFYIEGYLKQVYEGGGKYGPTVFEWYRSDEFKCNCLK